MEQTFDLRQVRDDLGITWHEYKIGRRPAGGYECALCGRVCPKPSYMARFIDGGLDTVATDEFADRPENQSGDMGCYPIGPECIKKIRKAVPAEVFATFFQKAEG